MKTITKIIPLTNDNFVKRGIMSANGYTIRNRTLNYNYSNVYSNVKMNVAKDTFTAFKIDYNLANECITLRNGGLQNA